MDYSVPARDHVATGELRLGEPEMAVADNHLTFRLLFAYDCRAAIPQD